MTGSNDPLIGVAEYYSGKLREHGATARGVDWNSGESQALRFSQLMKVADGADQISVSEIGCGYGALVDFLEADGRPFDYLGVDIAEDMVAAADARFAGRANVAFEAGRAPTRMADVCVASGIFNVRLGTDDAAWLTLIHETMDIMDRASAAGFAFNALTKYSDADRMRPDLYYADPLALFDRCKRLYSRNVALLHDYGLYEFTIVVRKDAA